MTSVTSLYILAYIRGCSMKTAKIFRSGNQHPFWSPKCANAKNKRFDFKSINSLAFNHAHQTIEFFSVLEACGAILDKPPQSYTNS